MAGMAGLLLHRLAPPSLAPLLRHSPLLPTTLHLSTSPTLAGAVPTIKNKKRNGIPNRHWDPRWRKARAWKVLRMDLPDFEFQRRRARDETTPEELREYMKKMGMNPMAQAPPPTYISSFGTVLDTYVPPEGDGKASWSGSGSGFKEGVREKLGQTKDRLVKDAPLVGKTKRALKKIRSYEEDWREEEWVEEAQEVYKAAHFALAEGDEDKMHRVSFMCTILSFHQCTISQMQHFMHRSTIPACN